MRFTQTDAGDLLFMDTPWYCDQPLREPIDLSQPDEAILAQAEAIARRFPRFMSCTQWQAEHHATGFDCVLTGMFGLQVLDIYRELGDAPASLAYGRPRPLFLGAAPKVLLASFGSTLKKVFESQHEELARCGLPAGWSADRRYFAAIRKAGHYVSNGALESQLAAVAAPGSPSPWCSIPRAWRSSIPKRSSTWLPRPPHASEADPHFFQPSKEFS